MAQFAQGYNNQMGKASNSHRSKDVTYHLGVNSALLTVIITVLLLTAVSASAVY